MAKKRIKHNGVIMCIPDLHTPFEHPDAFAFTKYIKNKYKPTLIINGGDEVDFSQISFHKSLTIF